MWERIHTTGADTADDPYNVWRYSVPGGWIYVHCNYGVVGTVFVPEPNKVTAVQDWTTLYTQIEELLPEDGVIDDQASLINAIAELVQRPSKVTAEQGDDLAYPEWERGHKAGYMQAMANEKAKMDEIIASLETVLDRIEQDEKTYAANHIIGIINALRSET